MVFSASRRRVGVLAALLLGACAAGAVRPPRQTEVALTLVSAELRRFEPAITVGAGKNAIRYREALVIKVAVRQAEYDALPPDIEPFLYVGAHELHTFAIERPKEGERDANLVLTFHLRDPGDLPASMPLVLTTDHGAPQRDPRRFADAPVLKREQIVDRR
jgi:hypothetical protein